METEKHTMRMNIEILKNATTVNDKRMKLGIVLKLTRTAK